MVVPKPLLPFSLDGITITAFDGLHWEIVDQPQEECIGGNFRGVPSLGYFVEFPGNRWLFPGDTRTYELSRIPDFGTIDLVFAHMWLGRRQALVEKPALLEDFCRFHQGLQPRQIILSHLGEFGRPPASYWDLGHTQQVRAWFHENVPEISVFPACSGESLLV